MLMNFKLVIWWQARRNYYWDDENYGYGELENVGIKGEWVNNLVTTRGRISEINTIENAKGYSGLAHWPWFQITNFEKV